MATRRASDRRLGQTDVQTTVFSRWPFCGASSDSILFFRRLGQTAAGVLACLPPGGQNTAMPRRKRRNWPLLLAIFAVAGLLLVYAVAWPLACAYLAPASTTGMRVRPGLAPLAERIPIRLFEFSILSWLFVFGSCIGSFLNVVIHRTPRGQSLWGSSHCPRCQVRISAWDNLPVFGWLKLRGRCRTCHLPISPRYPLVELTVGLVILVLATLEVLLGGFNLPEFGERAAVRSSIGWLIGHPRWELVATCILHSGLVCVLLSWALIRHDGFAVPRRYALGAFVAAWLLMSLAPLLQPAAWRHSWLDWQTWAAVSADGGRGLLGLVGGLLMGLVVAAGCRLQKPADALLGLGLVGVGLGWQAAVSVGLLASAARLVGALMLGLSSRRCPLPLLAYVCLAALVHICLWRGLDGLAFWPGGSAGLPTFAVAVTMVLGLTWQASVLERSVNTR